MLNEMHEPVCMYVCVCVCMYVCMCVCMSARMCMCMYVCMCVCKYGTSPYRPILGMMNEMHEPVCMYVCVCVCVYECTHVYVYV